MFETLRIHKKEIHKKISDFFHTTLNMSWMERPVDMLDAVRLGDVKAVTVFYELGDEVVAHTSGNLYICEAVCSRNWSTAMLDFLLEHGSSLFDLDVYGKSAVHYVLQFGDVRIMAYMREKIPDIANHEIVVHDIPATVSQAATAYCNPDMLMFLYENGGILHYGSYFLKKIIHNMWVIVSGQISEEGLIRFLTVSVKCIAVCTLMGQDPMFSIPVNSWNSSSTALDLYLRIPIKPERFPKAAAHHRALGALMGQMPLLRSNLTLLKDPMFARNADVWRYSVDRRKLQKWAEDQKQAARRCYAALYHGESETARGRIPIRALCDADTVRELITLFLVFPNRRSINFTNYI
jgi:hypothetical protein